MYNATNISDKLNASPTFMVAGTTTTIAKSSSVANRQYTRSSEFLKRSDLLIEVFNSSDYALLKVT
jgi:hypothetical protein